jgi:hypothetical protein
MVESAIITPSHARFPFVRDLVGFDFAAQPSIDPKQVRERAVARARGGNLDPSIAPSTTATSSPTAATAIA